MTNVLYVARPVHAQEHGQSSVFRADGQRVKVRFGRSSVTTIEVVEGLREGDRIITSDMSAWAEVERVQVR